ncbi:MAG TPA: PAS domain S-box protein [Bacteroidia bacterium]|nr:PAS domain S-box protein [Bacteroidia bacterium]
MEPLRVSPNKSFLAGYEENYYRVIFSLFGLAYLFSYYYKGPDMVPLKEFLIPRNIFAALPFILIGLSYIIPYVRTHIKDIGSGFYLLCTLHLVGFFSTNNFNTHYEIGIITLVLFSNLHLNKVLYIVLYNVIVLTALEYVFITAVPTANIQPVLFFLFLLSVMLICIFYQLYRIRFNNQVNERDELLSGIISGNPEAWMIFEGPGLIAKDGSANALKMFQIKDTKELEQISLRTLIAAESVNDSDEIIRSIIAKPVFTIKTQCRKQSGELFWADVSSFRIPGRAGFIQCRFLDITENKNIQVNATENAIRYRSYLDNTGDGLIICDSSLNVVLVNKEAVSIFKSESTGNFSGKSLEALTGSEIVNQLTKGTSEIPNLEMDAFTSISVTDDTDKRYTFYIKKITDLISNNTEILIRVSTTEKKETPLESKSEVLPQQPITIIQDPGTTLLQSGIPSFIADDTGNIQEVNEPLILFLGYNQEELKSLHAENIIHPKDLTLFRNIFNNSKIATQKKHTDLRIIGKSGKTKFVQLYCSSHTIQAGEEIVLILLNDITSFKKAEEELVFAGSNVNAVIENTDAPIFSVDFNHRISVMNTAFSREIQKRTGVIPSIGSDYRDYLSTENKLTWNTLIPKIMRGEVMRLDEIISYQDGSVDYFEVSYYPITTSENAIIGVSVLAGKVTERIKFEKELIKSKETAEKATKAKSEFLSTMSHEIRTPLNGLLGMSELLNTTKLNERQREFVDAIKLSGEALLTIINDVLDFSRIESEKLELQNKPFSLKKTIDETFDILYYKAIEQGNKLLVSLEASSDICESDWKCH